MSDTHAPFRIAYLASHTGRPVVDAIKRMELALELPLSVYEAPYAQVAQEFLVLDSPLYQHDPQLTIVHLDAASLAGDAWLDPYAQGHAWEPWVEATYAHVTGLIGAWEAHASGLLIFHTLVTPWYSPLGWLEGREVFGVCDAVRALNDRLRAAYRTHPRVYLFDADAWSGQMGQRHILDPKLYYLGDIRVSLAAAESLAQAYAGVVRAMTGRTKKCLVLDLDQTLWGGVIGEDGLEGIALGPTPAGRPFMEFQRLIVALFHRGVIVAINSKNNADDVTRVFREHPHMCLREEHIAAWRVNWEDKASNMRALSDELNIGLESMVFLDDDPLNVELVREQCPGVDAILLPRDPSAIPDVLRSLHLFDTLTLTEEDRQKGAQYAAQRLRENLHAETVDVETYLRRLEMRVTIRRVTQHTAPRVAQLTQKTNQFNTTTRRCTHADIVERLCDADWELLTLSVCDRFGDNGLTGVAMLKRVEADIWDVETFLLSCRIIGRRVELALLAAAVRCVAERGGRILKACIIPTEKNMPARSLFDDAGFTRVSADDEEVKRYEWDVSRAMPVPSLYTATLDGAAFASLTEILPYANTPEPV